MNSITRLPNLYLPITKLFLLSKLLHQNICQCRLTDLLQLIAHTRVRLRDLHHAGKINWGADNDQVNIRGFDRCFEVFDLCIPIAHGREDRAVLRILGIGRCTGLHSKQMRFNDLSFSNHPLTNNFPHDFFRWFLQYTIPGLHVLIIHPGF